MSDGDFQTSATQRYYQGQAMSKTGRFIYSHETASFPPPENSIDRWESKDRCVCGQGATQKFMHTPWCGNSHCALLIAKERPEEDVIE